MYNPTAFAQQLNTMFQLQDELNKKVSDTWREDRYEWYRAMWTESAELMEHYGWKWWKKQTPDIDQVKLELVDIWHFGMSDLLQRNDVCLSSLVDKTASAFKLPPQYTEFKDALEHFTGNVLTKRSFDLFSFVDMLNIVGITPEQLYTMYMGKNVLNFFRQDHGYKDGSYIKVWNGREDNEHLAEILNTLDSTSPTFKDDIYKELENRYPQ